MKKIILIKLGGSLITDKSKPYTARSKVIRRLAREIKFCWGKGFCFLISHGGGSFSHTSAAKYKISEGVKNKAEAYGLSVVQSDALALDRIVNKIFVKEGVPILSFAPSSFTFASKKTLLTLFAKPILQSLKIGVIPMVFGDIILDKSNGCCVFSGETTLDNLVKPLIGKGYKVKKVIHCGITDGVYDANGKTIIKINEENFKEFKKSIFGSSSTDVTGGMLHKVKESLAMAKKGISSQIIDGKVEGNLKKAILGKLKSGTTIE